jgi:hypothetical protein
MNISIKKSYEVAVKLCQKKAAEVKEKDLNLINEFSHYYLRTLSLKEINNFKKNPSLFLRSSVVNVKINDTEVVQLYLNRVLPVSEKPISLKPEAKENILNLLSVKEQGVKEYGELFNEIQEALVSLYTYENIKYSFPEAFEVLNSINIEKTPIDLEKLRTKI